MQNKDELPEVTGVKIFVSVPTSSQTLFKPTPIRPNFLTQLLLFSTQSNIEQIKKFFSIMPERISYLTKIGEIKDDAGWYFPSASAFQYMVWAYDREGWMTMLNALQEAVNAGYPFKDAEEIRGTLFDQFKEVQQRGLYCNEPMSGLGILSKGFDFQPILNALMEFIRLYESRNEKRVNQWCKIVGKAQQKLPNNIVHWYTSGLLTPDSTFSEEIGPDRSITYWNYTHKQEMSWYDRSKKYKPGVDFAIYNMRETHLSPQKDNQKRFWCVEATEAFLGYAYDEAPRNLAALTALYNTRKKNLKELESLLLKPLTPPHQQIQNGRELLV